MSEGARARPISFTALWADTVAMVRSNLGLLTAVAGVFLFMPPLLLARLLPPPEEAAAQTLEAVLAAFQTYYESVWLWLILGQIVLMIGCATIYALLLAEPKMTVGRALARALAVLPFYYLLTIIWNLAVGFGLLFLIVPGIYLLGRLAVAFPILVADRPTAPIASLREAWAITGERAWAIAGFVILVGVAAMLIGFMMTVTVGSLLLLIGGGPEGVGGLLVAMLSALIQALTQVVITAVFAAIYRALKPRGTSLEKTFN